MEKKLTSVGIITMHKSDNYGAVLQSYALVKAIEKVGAKAEIINYIPERFKTSVQFFYVHPRRYNSTLKKYIIMAASLPIRALIYYRYNTFLKEYLPVGKNVYYSEEDLETKIGSNVLIGWDCEFADGDAHKIYDSTDFDKKERKNVNKPIIIGDRVWFSAHVKTLKGVIVGNDTVIAEGTVLSKSFRENNIVVGGNPPKILKKDIVWEI